jgi:hypothetical protein
MDVKEFVVYHREILNLGSKLQHLFKEVVFVQFISMTLLLCVDGFQLIEFEGMSKKFNAFFHTATALIDLFIYSYGGQKIMDSSKSVCDENENIDKSYVVINMRAQSELKIDTGFFNASLPTFSTILNRVMSLITLLQSFL